MAWPAAASPLSRPISIRGIGEADHAEAGLGEAGLGYFTDGFTDVPLLESIAEAFLEWLDPHAWDFDAWGVEAPMLDP